ncbi:hypothetical protein NM688_g2104 [Phlebia brevispora]|uniref:Uncharacterized protein n=1 Tax=Phlebia brevispora TaxID=194682 RepID=A0ACC1T9U3_9APHY|nr:hypothetical protein NM688_g2104 [Phlebia brevispora]
MRLLLTGATGVAGLNIYRAALTDPDVTSITILMRREMPSWAAVPSNASQKTTTIVHKDFTSYPPDLVGRLVQHDACIWAMGKSSLGMSEADYTSLTYAAPMSLAVALRDAGIGKNRPEDKPFRFVYVSGEGADPTDKSSQMWARVKGRAEKDIAALCTAATGMKAHVIRPAYFRPSREYSQDWANQRSRTENYLDRLLSPVFTCFFPQFVSPLDELSKVSLEIAKGRWPDVELFRNQKIRELAKQC